MNDGQDISTCIEYNIELYKHSGALELLPFG